MDGIPQEIFDEICERIADGQSLRAICADEHMPTKAKVFYWLAKDERMADQYARARQAQADSLFDDILSIADTEDDTNKARVRIDARKWMAGKLRPKVYGDKLDVDATVRAVVSSVPLTEDDWAAQYANEA